MRALHDYNSKYSCFAHINRSATVLDRTQAWPSRQEKKESFLNNFLQFVVIKMVLHTVYFYVYVRVKRFKKHRVTFPHKNQVKEVTMYLFFLDLQYELVLIQNISKIITIDYDLMVI